MARKFAGHTPNLGKTFRICPHSALYKERYYDLGYLGNSTNPNLPVNTSVHTDTDGYMITAFRGTTWGFMCMDDDCWYFLNNGMRYFEC